MQTPFDIPPSLSEGRVFRDIRFDVQSFDRLKDWERVLSRQHGRKLSNAEVLRVLLLSAPLPE